MLKSSGWGTGKKTGVGVINCTGVQKTGVALWLSVKNACDMPRVQSILKVK